MTALPVAVLGDPYPALLRALEGSGAAVVTEIQRAEGIVVSFGASPAELRETLDAAPRVRWVQLPSAGIEAFLDSVSAHPDLAWTSAKGAYAAPVAEHALALVLALLRRLPARARAQTWGAPAGTSLHGLRALVLGGGGVAQETVRLLKAFDTRVTAVRRTRTPVPLAEATLAPEAFRALLPETDVLVLAAALTPDTRHLVDAAALDALPEHAVIVNIGRGGLIDTGALTAALAAGRIAGAALDVTEPEPLPDGHPLWAEPRALITPHTADTMEMIRPLLADRAGANAARIATGSSLLGIVDPDAGY